ncbi:EAL domain-containing protein [Oceanobacter kriegii]|uniref:EAL domain-containing protein n=1 Tax=Oceanobacter kriegii TaxID=64972 RepID=UPI00041BF180|nr:EAL domain-containing protein [Oceanobacter kriegii]
MLFRQHNLKARLTIVVVIATTLTLLLSGGAYVGLEYYLTSHASKQRINTIAEMAARSAAQEIKQQQFDTLQADLQSLSVHPAITLGCLYNQQGGLLAHYDRETAVASGCPATSNGAVSSANTLVVPLTTSNNVIGSLRINHDDQPVQQRLLRFLQISVAIWIVSMALAFLVAIRIREGLFGPLRDLSDFLARITRERNYSLRTPSKASDDYGKLLLQVNELLHATETDQSTLKLNEERFRKLAEFSPVGIFQVDKNGVLRYVNQRWRDIHNLTNEIPDIEQWFSCILAADLEATRFAWENLVSQQESIELDLRLQQRDGSHAWIHLMASPMHDRDGEVIGYLGAISDISELKSAQLQMENLAFYDALTGLANRRLFKNRLSKSIKSAERTQSTLALMFLDMDQFKRINDSMGHDAGDLLLQEVSRRLSANVRDKDTVSRIGGDEFTILLTDVKRISDVKTVAEKILEALAEPIRIKGQDINTSVSIGITLTPQDSTDPNTLMKNADLAMYKAKELGRNNYQFFSEEMNKEILEHLAWEQEIRDALHENQFSLVYQPKVSLQNYAITGVETLIRWHHPIKGFIPPDRFIKVAEETGQIIDIGRWVMQNSCREIQSFIASGDMPFDTRIAVNLSAKQFADPDLANMIRKTLEETGMSPSNLELEITESTLMLDVEKAIATMSALRSYGIRFAIDDFGTGYSSLSYLKSLPIEVLKVDRSFVNDIPVDSNDMAITAAVIAMAHKLGLQVVAEGVESEDQVEFLRQNRCDEGQGYLFSRPLDVPQLEEFLAKTRAMTLESSK